MPADLPTPFHFAVRFVGQGSGIDASFQEVSGIGVEMQAVPHPEGGENRFQHRLPQAVKHSCLTLKRGIVPIDSKLVAWCRETFEGGLEVAIKSASLEVILVDSAGDPLRQWTFTDAYPVQWVVDPSVSSKTELVIEKIEIAYDAVHRKA